MLNYSEGSLFNENTTALVNAVNTVGVMGTGIALEFMLRYPDMFADYNLKCQAGQIKTGQVDYYRDASGLVIVNFPTKWHFKYPSKLEWIEQGLKDFINTYQKFGITSVAFPKLGAGNGGLEWPIVQKIMEKYLSPLDADIVICLDSQNQASGIEKDMLSKFHSSDLDELSRKIKLSAIQKGNFKKHMPYNRFWQIRETESIGLKTYSALFRYFYQEESSDDKKQQQISLFDLQ